MDLDITQPLCGSQFFYTMEFYKGLLKMTILWLFSYNSYVKFSHHNTINL